VFTWSQDVLTSGELVIPISKDDPTDVSSIVGCAVLTGAGAVLNTARVRPADSVAVYGVGGVGLSAIQMASILEAHPIIAVDLRDDKLEFAKQFGATHGINASQEDPVEAIQELTGGGGVDFAYDAIGLRVTNEQILPSTRGGGSGADNHGGMAVLIGIPGKEMTIDPRLFVSQRTFRGSLGATYPEKDFPMFLRWHREGKFPLDKLVTRRYQLEQINEACDALEAGEILGRAIIEY
jgi:Zn-dependent alcohol dehydrogenase